MTASVTVSNITVLVLVWVCKKYELQRNIGRRMSIILTDVELPATEENNVIFTLPKIRLFAVCNK
jgi:hypothetical protein